MHQGDNAAGHDSTQGDTGGGERVEGDKKESDGEGNEGDEEREGGEPVVEAHVPGDTGLWAQDHMHSDEVHAPDAHGHLGDGRGNEPEEVEEALVGSALGEEQKRRVGAERRDDDGGDDDARIELLGDRVLGVVPRQLCQVCAEQKDT